MGLSSILKSAAGTRPFCHQKAVILQPQTPRMPQNLPGWLERDDQSRRLGRGHSHLRREDPPALPRRDRRSYDGGDTVNQPLEEGWKQGVAHSMADGIVTQTEEARFREFRDRLRPLGRA